jgi:hypothetical protein
MRNQGLTGAPRRPVGEVVQGLCAVQAQDYGGAKWGLAQRTPGATDAYLDEAFARGEFLRTHMMRPTWHFVHPRDVGWILGLTSSRVHALNAPYYRRSGLDSAVLRRCHVTLGAALRDRSYFTRAEIARRLAEAGVPASGERLAYILMHAELDGLITSGPRRGRQFTYALLDERASGGLVLGREEALAELVGRYFASHGPATVRDFAWWSGLTQADARRGIDASHPRLDSAAVDGRTYWYSPGRPPNKARATRVHLLPNYDEHVIAYQDHGPSLDPGLPSGPRVAAQVLGAHIVALNGVVLGGWRRTLSRDTVSIETVLLRKLRPQEREAFEREAGRYTGFLGLSGSSVRHEVYRSR